MIDNKEDLDYDIEVFNEVNEKASKLLEARFMQFQALQKGVTDGEGDID